MKKIIEKIRDFNRAYTANLGILDNTYLDSDLTLTETRILFEILKSEGCSAYQIKNTLHLNEGYISRVIKKLEKNNLLKRVKSLVDQRTYELYLTETGERKVNLLADKARKQIENILKNINQSDQEKLVDSMLEIRRILNI